MYKTIRDGQPVWPVCESCGCRLEISPDKGDRYFLKPVVWAMHFGSWLDDKDSRGCRCVDTDRVYALDPEYAEQFA